MKKVKSGSDISFSFNVKVTDKTTVDEIIREASDIIKVRFAEYKVEPEESEDERVRKWLVDYFTSVGKSWIHRDISPNEILAYLEKQKEITKSADSIPSNCTSDAKHENWWHKTANSLPDNGRDVLAKDALGNYLLASFDGAQWFVSVYDGEDHPVLHTPPILEWCEIPSEEQKPSFGIYWHKIKKGERLPCRAYVWNPDYEKYHDCFEGRLIANMENILVGGDTWYLPADDVRNLPREGVDELPREQKPAEKQDYSGLTDLERAIHRGFLVAGVENVPVTIIKETAHECLEQMKPAEWSEEDERMTDNIVSVLGQFIDYKSVSGIGSGYATPRYTKEIDWLKSLRPQHRDYAITFWTYLDEHRLEGKMCLSNEECADIEKAFIEHDWGKIIRYANKYAWKPSKEQLDALKELIDDANRAGWVTPGATELYEQLKKLM